ncbi:MAG: bifunctional oligoribonuclease/PAP phosphatase NrnA [Clostridia bacterium]|nr:bifunctional oligoribonuclease/PAP phosphatase NrnA [Clostridia bacterium]
MFEKIIDMLNKSKRIGIFTHINPDGDALGSVYSLRDVLHRMGKMTEAYFCGSTEPRLVEIFGAQVSEVPPSECDFLIALDCAAKDRLGRFDVYFDNNPNTAAIDHHITHVPYAAERTVADISSNCELMYRLYREMKVSISADAARYLYVGIITDTGSFKYSSVKSDTLRTAAELLDIGVNSAALSKKIFDTKSRGYLKLYARAIDKLEYYSDNRIAVLRLSEEDFNSCGTNEAEASAVVSLPRSVDGVELGVYVRDRGDECKVSLRASEKINAAKLAEAFGGGGHVAASGYSVKPAEAEDNLRILIREAERQLDLERV